STYPPKARLSSRLRQSIMPVTPWRSVVAKFLDPGCSWNAVAVYSFPSAVPMWCRASYGAALLFAAKPRHDVRSLMTDIPFPSQEVAEQLRHKHYNATVDSIWHVHDSLMIIRVRPDGEKLIYKPG